MNTFDALAKKILHESLHVQKGETVTVETWKTGLELAKRVILEARKIGATTLLLLEDEDVFVESAKSVPKEHLGMMGRHEFSLLSQTDAYVFIPGPPIAAYTKLITQEERSATTAYNQSWYEAAEKARLRGARLSFGYVGSDIAKLYGKTQKEIISHQLKASLADYGKIREQCSRIAANLAEGEEACIISKAGMLNFTLKGDFVIEDGIVDDTDIEEGKNMVYLPPGRVRRHIDPKSVNGKVEVSSVEIYSGIVEGVRLEFKEGVLQSYGAKRNAKLLDALMRKVPIDKRQISFMEVGVNPLMRYGYAQDRFVSGAVTLGLPRLAGVLRTSTLSINDKSIVAEGKIA
jgi:aminopeptidase